MENELTGAAVAPVQPENTVIPPYKSYQEYKNALDNEVSQEFEGYVRIGYLLKLARDTNILYESGYKDLYEFANAEYHLDKSRVSRYMAINDRFALDGYSMELKEEYKGFGIAKLQLMLQLPDAINEGLTPEYTKSEIQAIKDEVDEENKVSDIERMLEPQPMPSKSKSLIGKVIMQLAKDEPELYLQVAETMKDIWSIEDVKEVMAPDGVKTYSVRIPGTGRIMLMLDESRDARIVNARTGETEETGWGNIGKEWEMLVSSDRTPEEHWEELYCEPFPKAAAVAPVQPMTKKEPKVTKAKPDRKPPKPKESVAKQPESVSKQPENVPEQKQAMLHEFEQSIPEPDPKPESEAGEQEDKKGQQCDEGQQSDEIQGQDNIENHSEWMPEGNQNVLRGYRAAVTNNLRQLQNMWEGENPDKVNLMVDMVKDLLWRLEEIQKLEKREWNTPQISEVAEKEEEN